MGIKELDTHIADRLTETLTEFRLCKPAEYFTLSKGNLMMVELESTADYSNNPADESFRIRLAYRENGDGETPDLAEAREIVLRLYEAFWASKLTENVIINHVVESRIEGTNASEIGFVEIELRLRVLYDIEYTVFKGG